MTFEEWWDVEVATKDTWVKDVCQSAWESAFDEGVKWALQQDANTLNKLQLTLEQD